MAAFYGALRAFGLHASLGKVIIAYATGYAATRRSLPLGGAGITEALLTLSLIAVHVHSAHALLAVVAYRIVNFLAPVVPGLFAHSSLAEGIDGAASGSGSTAT